MIAFDLTIPPPSFDLVAPARQALREDESVVHSEDVTSSKKGPKATGRASQVFQVSESIWAFVWSIAWSIPM